ncbi:hypothetical protein ACOW8K_002813 [Vibrio parahaemolyticus]|nr:hypothetical protein [Vibrio parahaemolyticus]EJG1832149.1 hypothetical protein [Vibrio parahaemolyticus]HAS6950761.1 hypothetical protein [Vibrio parahaemolyticus]
MNFKKTILIIATSLTIVTAYVNAGPLTKAINLGAEFVITGLEKYRVYVSDKLFKADIDKNYVKSQDSWTGEIGTLKKKAGEFVGDAKSGLNENQISSNTKSAVSYVFNEKVEKELTESIKAEVSNTAVSNTIDVSKEVREPVELVQKQAEKLAKKLLKKSTTFPVTINTTPNNSKVRIMNIGPKYKDGIKLTKGRYDIEVSKSGYRTQRFWIDFDPVFNSLDVKLHKKGSLTCSDYNVVKSGSILQPYGTQVQIVDYLEGVTVSELYFSMVDYLSSKNFIEFYDADIAGNFAYFSFIYGFLDMDDINQNKKIQINPDRFIREFVGFENDEKNNRVKLVMHIETPQYGIAYNIDEAYCEFIKEL